MTTSAASFIRGLTHLGNFMLHGPSSEQPEIVFKFKSQREAMIFEANLKAAQLENGTPLHLANETPGKQRFTVLGFSIKIAHPDVMPYAPMKKGEKA